MFLLIRCFVDYVLISDIEGSVVQIPAWQCFQSKHKAFLKSNKMVNNTIRWGILRGFKGKIPGIQQQYLPIPRSSNSFLVPPPQFANQSKISSDGFNLVAFGGGSDSTLGFYSYGSNRCKSSDDASVFEFSSMAIDATKTVFRGAIGAARRLGWFSSTTEKSKGESNPLSKQEGDENIRVLKPFHFIVNRALVDPPRQVVSVSIDPSGGIMAAADALGRILLIDLSTNQVIRIWKGFRDAQCYWIQVPLNASFPTLYLLIHAQQRQFIEIYRMRHGRKVRHLSLRKNDKVFQCLDTSSLASCYLFKSENDSLSEIHVEDDMDSLSTSTAVSAPATTDLNLRLLQQLLSSNLTVDSDKILKTFVNIPSLKELSEALDLLALSSSLESKISLKRPDFHAKLIQHTEVRLTAAIIDKGYANKHHSQFNDIVVNLKFHKQVSKVFIIF